MTRNDYWDSFGSVKRRFIRGQARIRTSHGGNGGAAHHLRAAAIAWPDTDRAWAREAIKRGLWPCLAGPKGRLP